MPVKIENRFDDFKKFLDNADKTVLDDIGVMVDKTIFDGCPKRTGDLSRAGFHEVKKGVLRFINDMSYAAFVHRGTYRMHANPWMLRGIHKDSERIAEKLVEAFKV